MIIVYNGWIKQGYDVENITWTDWIFLGKKTASQFCTIYNFTIAITRIHFAICEVRTDNSNPAVKTNYIIKYVTK